MLFTSVKLKQAEAGWTVQGESQGKKLDEKLPGDTRPGTWIEQALALRKLLARDKPVGAKHGISMWMVNDLVKLTDAKTKVLSKKETDEYTARATAGAIDADLTLDAKSGMPKSADFPMGPATAHIERVYESGGF